MATMHAIHSSSYHAYIILCFFLCFSSLTWLFTAWVALFYQLIQTEDKTLVDSPTKQTKIYIYYGNVHFFLFCFALPRLHECNK